MAELHCTTTKYTYTFEYQLKGPGGQPAHYTASGSKKELAEKDALKRVPDADVKAALDAAQADAETYTCKEPCTRNISKGDVEFVATSTYNKQTQEWEVDISTAEVEVTISCIKKKLKMPKPQPAAAGGASGGE